MEKESEIYKEHLAEQEKRKAAKERELERKQQARLQRALIAAVLLVLGLAAIVVYQYVRQDEADATRDKDRIENVAPPAAH